jgi:hypothetical protein
VRAVDGIVKGFLKLRIKKNLICNKEVDFATDIKSPLL